MHSVSFSSGGSPSSAVGPMAPGRAPQFSARVNLSQPGTIAESRFNNDRVSLKTDDLVRSLLDRLDEAMTVAGEAYAANEAFTSVIDVKIDPQAWQTRSPQVEATVDTRVEHAMNIKDKIGVMILGTQATDYFSGQPIASARATFNAIDAASVNAPGGLKVKTVPPLSITSGEDRTLNQSAVNWNDKLPGFYRNLAKRLEARNPEAALSNLAREQSSKTRLINSNLYVSTDMMNKKGTGHGGTTAAKAVQDMAALTKKYAGSNGKIVVERVTANYLAPYNVNDALQFDTTIDHVDGKDVYLSSRISKLDTKRQVAEGPIILVHAKARASANLKRLDAASMDTDARTRKAEALAWAELPK